MSKKIDITNSINTIDDGGLNTALEVRTVLDVLKNNAYGDVVTETKTSIVDTTPNTSTDESYKNYALRYVKQGKVVSLNGNITNKSGAIVSNIMWFTFDSSDYLPSTDIIEFMGTTTTGTNVKCKILGSVFTVVGALGNNETIYFNTNYFTQD